MIHEAGAEQLSFEAVMRDVNDIIFKRDSSRQIEMTHQRTDSGATISFTDSLYPGQTFTEQFVFSGFSVRAEEFRKLIDRILDHDGKQSEREAANEERRAIERAERHDTGKVLVMILKELRKLNAS